VLTQKKRTLVYMPRIKNCGGGTRLLAKNQTFEEKPELRRQRRGRTDEPKAKDSRRVTVCGKGNAAGKSQRSITGGKKGLGVILREHVVIKIRPASGTSQNSNK